MKDRPASRIFTTRHVAIVEGDSAAAEMMHTFFRLMDLEASLIAPGSDAVATIRRVRPDIALLDLDAPNLQALELAAEIRAALPGIGIVFLSNRAGRADGAPVVAKPGACFERLLGLMEVMLEV